MTWKAYLGFTILSLALVLILAGFQSAPGYMDAEYYYSMALRIANKEGLSEPFVWNYLTQVSEIPHPGFTYWMPLPALLSAVGIWVSGIKSFPAARAIHLILAAWIPALTMKITHKMTRSTAAAWLAGAFAVVPVFYNIFLGTTDSFAITMLLGGIFVLLLLDKDRTMKFLGLGGIAGLMHLARADGLIWILAGIYCALRTKQNKIPALVWVGAGYLIVMGPWYVRNLLVLGQLMPAGVSKTFWMTQYNDLFLYSSEQLTNQRWALQGLSGILNNVIGAGSANLKSALLIQGQLLLGPFVILGIWSKRRERAIEAAGLVWLAIFLLMTLIFPFAGIRGGFFHSGAAFQPLLWALASLGFYTAIQWGVQQRDWQKEKAGLVFGMALVILVAVASGFVFYDRVIGNDFTQPQWDQSNLAAQEIERFLISLGLAEQEPVLINNPPGLYAAGERPAVVIPSDDIEAVLQAGEDFGIRYLVLEENHPAALEGIYQDQGSDERFFYLGQIGRAVIFEISKNGDFHE